MVKHKKIRGFTLIELMIVVAVIAILAIIAYPSYRDSVRKARRVDAKSALTDIAQMQETFFARNGSYTDDMQNLHDDFNNPTWNDVPLTAPNNERFYEVRVLAETAGCPLTRCYRLRARRNSGTDQVNDRLQNLQLWSTGRKQFRMVGGAWTDGWRER
jgi:type IV pilus assembly protein PilE